MKLPDASSYRNAAANEGARAFLEAQPEATHAPFLYWGCPAPFNPEAPTAGEPVAVHVNHGRWLTSCVCNGAQLASREDHRFMCVECGNAANGGAFLPVLWPEDPEAVEAALAVREVSNQHWYAPETVEDLLTENQEYGVGEPA